MTMTTKAFVAIGAAASLLASACSVAPVMKPEQRAGSAALTQLAAKAAKGQAVSPSRFQDLLRGHQSFDQPFLSFKGQFSLAMDDVSRSKSVREVPSEGLPYYYLTRLVAMAKVYLGLARAHLAKGDLARAERAAGNAVQLVENRAPWSGVGAVEIKEESYKVFEEICRKRPEGVEPCVLWAKHEGELVTDYARSPVGLEEYHGLALMREGSEKALADSNRLIGQVNSEKTSRFLDALTATTAVASSALASYSAASIRSKAASRGYMTRAQASQLQSLRLSQWQADTALKVSLRNAGGIGAPLALLHAAASPTLFTQFTNASAGANPVGLVQDFVSRAQGLSANNPGLEGLASKLGVLSKDLNAARASGDPEKAAQAYSAFVPAYTQFKSEVRRAAP